jgi:uncharacterized protein (DUF885 family)
MSGALDRLFDRYWQMRLREDPLAASVYFGDHRYDGLLPEVGTEEYARQRATRLTLLTELRAIDSSSDTSADTINRALLTRVLADEAAELGYPAAMMALNRTFTFYDLFVQLPLSLVFNTVLHYQNYIERLRAFPRFVEGHISLMRAGIGDGYRPPAAILTGVGDAIGTHIVDDAAAGVLWAPFAAFPPSLPEVERESLAREGRTAILSSVVPAFKTLLTFLQGEYLPAARQDIATSSLPDGADFYRHRIRFLTTLDLTPDEIHRTGMEEVSRIRGEMEAVIREVAFQGSFADFLAFLRTDRRFYAPTPEALLREVAYILKRVDGSLPRLFRTLPRMPYGIQPVPADLAPSTTTAYYQPPAADGTRAGFYFVNTYDLQSRPLYEVEALSLHEAVPGHHLQVALQLESGTGPEFRRFAQFTAYVEGWGLYAERLGLEMGFYEDPYSNFGRLTYEMWRACRLVVDTGIHALGWSRQQAIDFMAENTALSVLNITNEVDRYIAMPGQALAYKLGELKIRELRARAERLLGGRFDVRAFHEVVLASGAVPLDMLEERVDAWIAES